MKVGVFNDLHAADFLMNEVLRGITRFHPGDVIVANGDLANRGMVTNPIVAVYYNVRRGDDTIENLASLIHQYDDRIQVDEHLVYDSIHSGTFLSELGRRSKTFRKLMEDEVHQNLKFIKVIGNFASIYGVSVYYLPGNGEVYPLDFDTSNGIEEEKLVSEDQRIINRIAKTGIFEENNVIYVNSLQMIGERTILLPLDIIDREEPLMACVTDCVADDVTHVICHFPPTAENMTVFFGSLFGYKPNTLETQRRSTVSAFLERFSKPLDVYCGHIHPGSDEQRKMSLPVTATFEVGKNHVHWVKPGHLATFEI